MAYTLTLTKSERNAIDWIGGRYRHGDELYRLLDSECTTNDEWEGEGENSYTIPEWVAWEIKEIVEEDRLACFSDSLRTKLYAFTDSIV